MLPETLKQELLARLTAINPYRIILFGSYAQGTPGPQSDVDLLVVTKDTFVPRNFSEKNAIYLRVAKTIIDIEKKIPIDLIVHTRAMHQKFLELGGMFSQQIAAHGAVLYENPD